MKTFDGYKKQALTDVYALLAGGGHKPLSEFSMAHTHPYLPLIGGTVTGNIILKGGTSSDMTYVGNVHPYIRFDNSDSSQNISLIFTDYDSYRRPAGIKLIGNQGNEWFEAANIYATTFYGALSGNSSTATKLQTPRTIWGQSFDGTGNVDNTLRIRQTTGNYCEGIRIQTADGAWSTIILGATADSGTNTNAWSIHRKADNNFAISRNSSDGVNGLVMTSTGMGLGTTAPTHRLDVRGDTKITGSIRDLAIGGGIYWNPYVESTTDSSDVASITVVKSGVAGGTTLVLSQMNDANDTIQFKTNGSARLYHNSYPILTTQNTYVSNNKGYINGTEITQVNNADTVDGVHANQLCRIYTFNVHDSIIKVGTLTSGQSGHVCKLRFNSGIGYNAGNQDKTMTVVIRASNGGANSNGFYFEAHSESYRSGEFTTFYLHQTSKTQCELYMSAFSWSGQSIYEVSFSDGDSWTNEISVQNALPTSNIFTLPNYQIAYTDYNVASATKLATARTIWGQSFDGTGNISGTLSGVAHIQFSADNTYNIGSNSAASKYIYTYWLGAKSGQKLELGANNSGYGQGLCIDTNLNVGIGTNTPTYKLHVNGTFRATNSTVSDLFVNTGDATLKIYTGITTATQNDGNICFQTSIDATDGQSHTHPTQYQSRCNIVLQPRGGQVYIGTNPGTGNTTYKLYVNSKIFSNGGFVKNGSSDSYVLLGGGGHQTISSLSVNYASSAGNADTVDGEHASNFSYTHQTSFDFSKSKSGRIVTFDESNTEYGWINGFASTHSNYLTSIIFNTHRTSNWYVGYIEANTSTGITEGLTAVKQLAFLDSKVADSDKLDGIHANGLLTALSNSNNGISITIGGTTKSISNISVNYANSAGNADTVDGQHFNWNNNKNDHTYLWAASDNGNAYLVHRASISVNYATYARYVYCTSGNYLNFQWSGQNDQPTWLWGSNDGANCYVWNPSNFSVYKANKSDQLEAYTSWGFTDPGRFVRAIRYNGWHTRLYMGYYRDATLENTVHVGYADNADTLDGNHASAFALVGHTHNYDNVYSKLGHTHDDRYYTESEINSKLSAYLPLAGGTMTGQIKGNNKGGSWIQGRANAALYQPRNVQDDWHPVIGFKTKTGSWEFGSVGSDDFATFSWGSDSNYNSGTNTTTVVYLRNTRGTIALTSEIPTVTNYYWANMKVSSTSSTSTSPTFSTCYTNNWFRSTGQTGWYNETYEGGWYMTDTTWVRTYNSKGIYTNTGTIYNLGHVWLACNNGYNVGIGTISPSYKLHVSGDSYATGWSRAASGFYCQDTGVHFTHNGTKGQIAMTSNNEFCWGANSNILYFNYAASSYGTTVTQYVWNAGSSSSYASHTMGHITLGNGNYQLKRVGSASSWYNGRDKAIVRQTSNAGDYCVIMSSKTANGSWEIGNDETDLCFTYITDSNYNNRNNNNPLQIWFTYEGIIHTSNYIQAAHFYENSDVRYKKILKNLSINSNTIANLPLFDFEWIENNSIGTGTSAQAVQQILPNLVSGTDKLTLDYGVLGTIAGITACKELVMQKSELQQLKEKVKQLEDKLRKYENI